MEKKSKSAEKNTLPEDNEIPQEESIQNTTSEKDSEIAELTNDLQRLQAEFENFQKRNARDNEVFRMNAKAEFIAGLLPMIDNIELALSHNSANDDFRKGIDLIYSQFMDYLTGLGLAEVRALDEKFDPTLHEALLSVESDKSFNTVIEVLQKGFMLNGRVIRTAKVKVSKGKADS